LKYLKILKEVKAVLGIQAKTDHWPIINLLILLSVIIPGCNRSVVTSVNNSQHDNFYDTTLYDIAYLEGTRQRLVGNISDAIKYLDKSLTINPESDGAAYQISQISMVRGDIDNAKKYALLALKLDNKNIWYLNNAANIYFQNKQLDSAAIFYAKIVDLYPEREDVMYNLGSLYIENEDYEKAEKIFKDFRKKYGEENKVLLPLINIYKEKGKNEEAEKLLKNLVTDEPDNTMLLGLLAEHYRATGKNKEAFSIYEKLFKTDPGNSVLQLSYIDFLVDLGEYGQVIDNLNILLLNDNVKREEKLQIFSRLLHENKLFTEMGNEIILSSLIFKASNEADPAIILMVTEVYEKTGKNVEIVDMLMEYINSYPEQYYVWERLLLKLNDLGKTDNLYRYSKEAATKFNMAPLPKLLYALAAIENDEYENALSELQKVRILVNDQPEYMVQILSMKADIHYRMKNFDESFKTYEEALIIMPGDPLLLNNYAYFLSEQNRELKKAGKMIRQCLNIETNATYLDTYAWVLYKSGKFRNAEKVMNSIFVNNKISDPDIIEHYGFIKRKMKDYEGAVTMWQNVLKIDYSRTYLIEEIQKCLEK